MTRRILECDEAGSFFVVGLDRADEVRVALSLAGFGFAEREPDDCGCGGPSVALFRMKEPLESVALECLLEELAVR